MWRFRLIRFRLTFTYTLLLTGAFSLFSIGLFVALHQVLYNDFYQRINNAADGVAKDYTVEVSYQPQARYPGFSLVLRVQSHTVGGDANPDVIKHLFLNANGKLIAGEGNNDAPQLASLAQDPKIKDAIPKAAGGSKQNITLSGKNGDTNVTVATYETGGNSYVLLLQSSMRGLDDNVALLQRVLVSAALCFTLLSAIGAWFLTGRVLQPISQITEKVRTITARDLSQRLNINQPDEIGRLANTFDTMIDRLQASFDRQKRFTSDASHELRTPLAVMQADISLAMRRPRTGTEYRATLESAQEEVARLSTIVSDLLTLARLDTDTTQIAHEPVALDELIDAVVSGLRPLAAEKSITLTYTIPGTVPIVGDAVRLKQVFSNLIDNAIAYTPERGAIRVALTIENAVAQVVVSDTGIGIAPADLPHVFERFYRSDEARAHNHEGTGLGLAIAQGAVQAHQGHIEVASVQGVGTTFTVCLPLAQYVDTRTDGANMLSRIALLGS